MKQLSRKWFKSPLSALRPLTMWSSGSRELLPDRFRIIITVVMPTIYLLIFMFGLSSAWLGLPIFSILVGTYYGLIWSILVAATSFISFIGLMFRLRIEIYSSIILTALMLVFLPFTLHIMFLNPGHPEYSRVAVLLAIVIYPIMPAWRVFDITLEIRKARQRQLYAASNVGGT